MKVNFPCSEFDAEAEYRQKLREQAEERSGDKVAIAFDIIIISSSNCHHIIIILLFITGRMGRCTRVGVPAKISGDEEQREGTTGLELMIIITAKFMLKIAKI